MSLKVNETPIFETILKTRPWHEKGLKAFNENYIKKKTNSVYDDAVHPQKLLEFIGRGDSVASYCVAMSITRAVFHKWIHAHQKFKDYYEFAMLAGESLINDVGMFVDKYHSIYWNSRNYVYKRKRLEAIEDFYSSDPIKRIDAINLSVKEGYINNLERKQHLESTELEFKIRNFIMVYEKAFGKNGVKPIEDMTEKELLDHAKMMLESWKDLGINNVR